MRFAVVEYNSKSGNVWRHTKDRPNYLADPINEIDPTSFGCYVSALAGAHIPLKGLIVGPVVNVPTSSIIWRKIIKKITGSWPIGYDLAYFRNYDVLLVVHQLSDAHELVNFISHVKLINPNLFVIGVATQPYGLLRNAFKKSTTAFNDFIHFMDESDIFLSVVKDTVDWYQKRTKTEVIYMPQPYPVQFALTKWSKSKEKKIFVAGVTDRFDISKGQLVAAKLQKIHPEYKIIVPKLDDLDYDFNGLYGAEFEVLNFEMWQHHLDTLARMSLVINTDYTFTRGRVQTDCAAVGTVSIGANSDGQRDLYEGLLGNPKDTIDTLVRLGDQLLTDDEYYSSVVQVARERLIKYDFEHTLTRIQSLVRNFRAIA